MLHSVLAYFFARRFKDYHLQGKETPMQDYQTWRWKCCWEKWQECWRIKVVVVLFFPQNRNTRTERTRKNYSLGITDSALFGIDSDLHSYVVETGRYQKLNKYKYWYWTCSEEVFRPTMKTQYCSSVTEIHIQIVSISHSPDMMLCLLCW